MSSNDQRRPFGASRNTNGSAAESTVVSRNEGAAAWRFARASSTARGAFGSVEGRSERAEIGSFLARLDDLNQTLHPRQIYRINSDHVLEVWKSLNDDGSPRDGKFTFYCETTLVPFRIDQWYTYYLLDVDVGNSRQTGHWRFSDWTTVLRWPTAEQIRNAYIRAEHQSGVRDNQHREILALLPSQFDAMVSVQRQPDNGPNGPVQPSDVEASVEPPDNGPNGLVQPSDVEASVEPPDTGPNGLVQPSDVEASVDPPDTMDTSP